MYQAVLFDVDGTLLSMSGGAFMQDYLGRMMQFFDPHTDGNGKQLAKAVAAASKAMEDNPGEVTNAQVFWSVFETLVPWRREQLEPLFNQFYQEEFPHIGQLAKGHTLMPKIVQILVDKGYPLAVATNPLFPDIANKHRLHWAGVSEMPWQEITDYEHYHFSKPNPKFFLEICEKHQWAPEKCLMIGNGMIEDMAATKLGMTLYLLTDEVKDGDPAEYQGPKGSREDLLAYVEGLPMYQF